jgi:outer membrane protein TolC
MKELLIILIALGFNTVQAQTILSIDEAMQIALNKNYAISVARNEGLAAKANNTAGNAGMLPDIGFNANYDVSTKYVRSRPLYGSTAFNFTNPGNSAVGANVSLNWTVFDGGKMFIAKDRLSEIQALGEIRFREQVFQTISDVISAYFGVVKLKQQLLSIEQNIEYNRERVKIAEIGFTSGAKKKTDLLQAKIDLNVNLENAINQQALILTAKRELANLLAIDNDSLFEVIDSITLEYNPNKSKLQQIMYSKNSKLKVFEKQLEIEKLILKENYRSQLPKIDFRTGYYYQRVTNFQDPNPGTLTYSHWPQVGLNLSVPIFQSGDLRRQIVLSKIAIESADFDFENVKLAINTELLNALTSFENQQKLLEIERENFELAKENMEISLQRMRFGEATSLEVRMAQTDFEQSATRLVNFQYNLKMAETKLKQLMGDL